MAWKYFWEIWNIWMCVCSPSSCLHSICFPAGGIALHIMHFSNQMEENLQNQKEWGISEHTFLSVPFWNISLQSFYNLFANCQKIAILSHIHIFIHSKVTSTIWYNTQTIIKTAKHVWQPGIDYKCCCFLLLLLQKQYLINMANVPNFMPLSQHFSKSLFLPDSFSYRCHKELV